MKLSVITINYNNCEGLRRTVESVVSQTATDYEYIVIDGNSSDGSKDVISQYAGKGIDKWVSEPDTGIYNAMNKGIVRAEGEYCIFMNSSDTFFKSDVLERVIPQLRRAHYYVGDTYREDFRGNICRAPEKVTAQGLIRHPLQHQSTFIKTCLLKERPYLEKYRIVSDWEQMVYWLIMKDATYWKLNMIVSRFDIEGFSSQKEQAKLLRREMKDVCRTYFSKRLTRSLTGQDLAGCKYEAKVQYAILKEPSPSRDLKLLRNSLKLLIIDTFHTLFPER